MRQSDISLRNIIHGIQDLPPEALSELDDFVMFLHHKMVKSDFSVQRKIVSTQNLKEELLSIGKHCAALPLLDNRTPDQILGYNEQGLPE